MLGRPALANPHWPIWAERELGHPSPFSLVQEDWRWSLENFRVHGPSTGLAGGAAGGGATPGGLTLRLGRDGFHAGRRKSGIGGADGKHGLYEHMETHVVYMQTTG